LKAHLLLLIQTKADIDRLIIEAVDEVLNYCLGTANASIICDYLKKRNYSLDKIPKMPEIFSEELRNLLGFGSRQILCAPSILEEQVLEILYKKLGICQSIEKPPNFPKHIRTLRETFGRINNSR